MKISDLIRMLEEIQNIHGDILVRCGQYRIGGIMLLKGQLGPTAMFVQKKVGSPTAGLPPHVGKERRKTPKRRWDDT